jgi:hypothetical protein
MDLSSMPVAITSGNGDSSVADEPVLVVSEPPRDYTQALGVATNSPAAPAVANGEVIVPAKKVKTLGITDILDPAFISPRDVSPTRGQGFKSHGAVWTIVRRLTLDHPLGTEKGTPYTHICQEKVAGGLCNTPMVISKAFPKNTVLKQGAFITNKPTTHMKRFHPKSGIAVSHVGREAEYHDVLSDQQAQYGQLYSGKVEGNVKVRLMLHTFYWDIVSYFEYAWSPHYIIINCFMV